MFLSRAWHLSSPWIWCLTNPVVPVSGKSCWLSFNLEKCKYASHSFIWDNRQPLQNSWDKELNLICMPKHLQKYLGMPFLIQENLVNLSWQYLLRNKNAHTQSFNPIEAPILISSRALLFYLRSRILMKQLGWKHTFYRMKWGEHWSRTCFQHYFCRGLN